MATGVRFSIRVAGLLSSDDCVEIGVTAGGITIEGVTVIVGIVGVIGVVVPDMGRRREARTPIRVPKRIRARTIRKVFKKPDFLDDEGAVGLGRGELGNVSGWDANGKIGSGLVDWGWEGIGSVGQASGGVKVGAVGGVWSSGFGV